MYRFLAAADVVIHTAIQPDSFPTVLLESMALGRAVIATDLGGPREIVEDGVTGMLVPPHRADLLAEAMRTLLADPPRRRKMGQAGAERSRERFHAARMAREIERLYEPLISNRKDGP